MPAKKSSKEKSKVHLTMKKPVRPDTTVYDRVRFILTSALDYVNDPEEVPAAFKTDHTTAELAATTDPNLVFRWRANRSGLIPPEFPSRKAG